MKKCISCGYAVSSQALAKISHCPNCGEPLVPIAEVTQAEITESESPGVELGDLNDLEFSSPEKTVSKENLVSDIQTNPQPKEPAPAPKPPPPPSPRIPTVQAYPEPAVRRDFTPQPRVSGSSPSIRVNQRSTVQRMFDAFAPIIMLCLIFAGWVVYDRAFRKLPPPPRPTSEQLLADAIATFQSGNKPEALRLAAEAAKADPNSPIARELVTLFEKLSKPTPAPTRRR